MNLWSCRQKVWKPILNVEVSDSMQVHFDEGWLVVDSIMVSLGTVSTRDQKILERESFELLEHV